MNFTLDYFSNLKEDSECKIFSLIIAGVQSWNNDGVVCKKVTLFANKIDKLSSVKRRF